MTESLHYKHNTANAINPYKTRKILNILEAGYEIYDIIYLHTNLTEAEAFELAKIKDAKEAKLAEQKQLAKNRKVKVRIKALINDGVTKRTVNVDAIGNTINAETISAMTSVIKKTTLNMAAIRNNDLKNDKYYIGRGWLNQYTEKLGFLNK